MVEVWKNKNNGDFLRVEVQKGKSHLVNISGYIRPVRDTMIGAFYDSCAFTVLLQKCVQSNCAALRLALYH